ncbi:DUF4865 family protein [Streptomyces vietnamensis]|uniref:DUF4865 domain-containing protein n=1 Tax=Streptomyces vietnamensis TaxID=362257 RepID=A0A0B5I011_9ACTN|nr:DUF4865 family protein [Streptomyces vietnamensis]AJF63852.1 hypothetical protein SVTN_04815 [Streptomyces vietnamensis]
MHAMQYEITLPADYDMEIIRKRVATKGHLLDAFPGLGLKAYLMREREAGSPVNQYAPFYLWASPEGMNSFLWGPGFQGIVNDFGRPVVQHWTGLAYEEGPAAASAPGAATRRRTPLGEGVPPGEAVAEAVARHAREARRDGVVASALAVDPRHWELLAFTLWAGPEAPADEGERFQVLHLSAPGRSALGAGRQW